MASRPRTTRERTYRTMYVADVGGVPGNDHVVFNHPNGLCVVCLSERHPLCATAADDAPAASPWMELRDARRAATPPAAKPLDPCAGVRGKKKGEAPDAGLGPGDARARGREAMDRARPRAGRLLG